MTGAAVELLDWDTAWWGVTTGRTAVATWDEVAATSVERGCRELAIELLYHLQPGGDARGLRLAQACGLRVVDVRLAMAAPAGPAVPPPAGCAIRPGEPADAAALADLAAASHRNTRFFADGRLAQERCEQLYRHWIRSDLDGRVDAVLVAEVEGAAAGYVSLEAAPDCARIGLIAVDETQRGRGLGAALVGAALAWAADRRRSQVEVVTQGTGVAAQRLYQRCGFVTSRIDLWLHRWSDEARPLGGAA